jgi:hypothetical protein
MIGFKEKAFGILALIGLGVTAHQGYEFWQVDQLKKHGKSLTGSVIECVPYKKKAKTRGNERLKMLIHYDGCKGATERKFVVFRNYELPENGPIQLLSNRKCPETIILRDAPNDAWKEGIVGVVILLAGSVGFFSGFVSARK